LDKRLEPSPRCTIRTRPRAAGKAVPKRGRSINEEVKNHIWLKVSVLILIVAGLTLILYLSGLMDFFLDKDRLLLFLESLGPWSFVGFIFLQSLQVVAAPIPGEVTGLWGGFLYGPVLGIVLSTTGLMIGSYVAFALSRAFGRPLVERFVPKQAMDRFDYLLHHKGAFLVFMLFLFPGVPKDYLCYILGLGHLSTLEFLVIGGTGRLFGTTLLTLGGNYLKLQQYGRFFFLVGVALVFMLVTMAYKDKIENLFKQWHLKSKAGKDAKYTDRVG
jgi:uncharacterized membrane protein YdjX (TVP38/TMEM64 family)